jgi:Flp pilus assembly protein TadD
VVRFPAEEASRLATQAVLAEARGDLAAARDDYVAAADVFETLEMAPAHAHAIQGLGRCLLSLRRPEEAVTRLRDARTLWEDMKAKPRLAEIDELLAMISPSNGGSA